MFISTCCRSAWHLLDVVPIIQRLRWGSHGFAALRYKNMPGEKVVFGQGSDETLTVAWVPLA